MTTSARLARRRKGSRPAGGAKAAAGGGEVDGERALAAIAGMEIGSVAGPVAIVDEGRAPLPGIVAGEALDLDHIGAEIGKQLPGPRPGEDAGEFDDPQSGKRSGHASDSTMKERGRSPQRRFDPTTRAYIAGDISRSVRPKPAASSTMASTTCSQLSPGLLEMKPRIISPPRKPRTATMT